MQLVVGPRGHARSPTRVVQQFAPPGVWPESDLVDVVRGTVGAVELPGGQIGGYDCSSLAAF